MWRVSSLMTLLKAVCNFSLKFLCFKCAFVSWFLFVPFFFSRFSLVVSLILDLFVTRLFGIKGEKWQCVIVLPYYFSGGSFFVVVCFKWHFACLPAKTVIYLCKKNDEANQMAANKKLKLAPMSGWFRLCCTQFKGTKKSNKMGKK